MYTYGKHVVDKKHNYDSICRAHQVVAEGFDVSVQPAQAVLTVYSTPDQEPDVFADRAAMLKVESDLLVRVH